MKTAAEYRKYAEECRALAKQMPDGEQRGQLLNMAQTWDNLAVERECMVRNDPELDMSEASAQSPPNSGRQGSSIFDKAGIRNRASNCTP